MQDFADLYMFISSLNPPQIECIEKGKLLS